jgi:hypothetical protein
MDRALTPRRTHRGAATSGWSTTTKNVPWTAHIASAAATPIASAAGAALAGYPPAEPHDCQLHTAPAAPAAS